MNHLPTTLAILILISRLGDIVSTHLATPTLKHEANPVARRFGWPFAALTVSLALIPYWSPPYGLVVLIPSLLVSASNLSKVWIMRTMGEQAYADFIDSIARRSRLSTALKALAGSVFFIFLAGATLLLFYPTANQWGYWFAMGILSYGLAIGVHGTLHFQRIFKRARTQDALAAE